jgi:hypothetical protein
MDVLLAEEVDGGSRHIYTRKRCGKGCTALKRPTIAERSRAGNERASVAVAADSMGK